MSNSENLKIISIAKKHQNRIFSYKEKTSKLEQTNETNHIIAISNNILMTLYNVITYLSNQNILEGVENIPSSILVACWSSISGAYYCLAEGNLIDYDSQNSWINANNTTASKSSTHHPLTINSEIYQHFFEGILPLYIITVQKLVFYIILYTLVLFYHGCSYIMMIAISNTLR